MNRRGFVLNTLFSVFAAPMASRRAMNGAFGDDPFTLGIASGDVSDRSAVLWTRLAPDPLDANGGMPQAPVPVQWELSLDASMSQVVRRGEELAMPALAHSVHVEVDDLDPAREYWYRFSVATHRSRVGRTRTLPAAGSPAGSARFVTASCQNYTHGYFVAYEHMVRDNPDFIIHLGDYIYDTSFGETFRRHESEAAPETLADYRRRHALYKTDRHLQLAHSQVPFFPMIDNHDAIEDEDPESFAQRAAAYQAWYEHMPVRGYGETGSNRFDLHRRIQLGDLAQICVLDPRQFRDKKELCTENIDRNYGFGNYRERCEAIFAERRSMLGQAQERWLTESVTQNAAAWNVIASPGPFLPFEYQKDGKTLQYIGAWDAYPANRQRIADAIAAAGTGHPLILSGDVHSFWALDGALVKSPGEPIPVVEFVTSSLTANWPAPLARPVTDNLPHNPQVRFYEPDRRGYLLHEVDKSEWKTTARAVDDVREENSPAFNLASFVVGRGKPGFTRVD